MKSREAFSNASEGDPAGVAAIAAMEAQARDRARAQAQREAEMAAVVAAPAVEEEPMSAVTPRGLWLQLL